MKVQTEPTVNSEVSKDWTVAELKRELVIWQNADLGDTQFYAWVKKSGIKPKRVYSDRDRKKLLKFAELMSRYKRLSVASEKLQEYINEHPGEFPKDG